MAVRMFFEIVYKDFHGAMITPKTAWSVAKQIWLEKKSNIMPITNQPPHDDNTIVPYPSVKEKLEMIRRELVKIANAKTTKMETNWEVNRVINMIDGMYIEECNKANIEKTDTKDAVFKS